MYGIKAIGLLFLTHFVSSIFAETGKEPDYSECNIVADKFSGLRIGHADLVPGSKLHDGDMEICYKGSREPNKTSCCTRKMERKYHVAATKDFSDTIKQITYYLKNMLQEKGKLFQDDFLKMVREAENQTLQTFNADFSIPAEDRRGPLDNFFMDLLAFIRQRKVDIHDTVSTFFNEIFPPVVQYLLVDSSKLEMDDDYRDCLMENRQSLIPRPFGDIPNKMAVELSHALGQANLFLEALGMGVEALNTTEHLPLDLQCSRAVTRLTYCAHCQGTVDVRPCRGYCHNVMRGCLAGVTQLDGAWNEYVDATHGLAAAMRGGAEVAEAMRRLPDLISEGIMNAMHSQHKYYNKVIRRCGQPKVVKADPDSPAKPKVAPKNIVPLTLTPNSKDQEVYKQMESFMDNMLASKGFYGNLADTVCTADRFSAGVDQPCWNGHSVGTYAELVPKVAFDQQSKNPEIKVSNVKPQALVSLADKLSLIKKKLHRKTSTSSSPSGVVGKDGEKMQGDGGWYYSGDGGYNAMDDEDYSVEYSGSGSGSGPGYQGGGGRYKIKDQYKTGRRGGVEAGNQDDEDIYLDEKNNQPYVKSEKDNEHNGGSTSVTSTTIPLIATLLSLWWIAG